MASRAGAQIGAQAIIAENERRNAALDAVYDPITGEGSPIPRVPLKFSDDEDWMVPEWMMAGLERRAKGKKANAAFYRAILEADSLSAFASMTSDPAGITKNLEELRCVWDFEYYCATRSVIEYDEETRKQTGKDVGPLILNAAQRILAEKLLADFFEGLPLRFILLKARQFGGSTFCQVFIAWIQMYHRKHWHSCILAPSQSQAGHLRGMYERTTQVTLAPYKGMSNMRTLVARDAIVGISSIEKPDALRGYTFHLLHMSEVGLWQSTPKKSAHDYIQAAFQTVPFQPETMILMESTAKGVGNYFHEAWQKAVAGDSAFKAVFIPWYRIEKYRQDVDDYGALINAFDDYDEFLWEAGASLEQINWYHAKLREFGGDRRRMQNEYPTTPDEAFQASGSPVFPIDVVQKRRLENVSEPIWKGWYNGNELEGTLQEGDGPLWIWKHPGEEKLTRRYVAFADFGGKTDQADWSVLTVLDQMARLEGDAVEVVARLRLHLRPDLFAWYCARVCAYYHDALLAFEINRHHKDRGDDVRGYEPEWSMAGIEAVAGKYRNLYTRDPDEETVDHKVSLKIGFHVNTLTKPKMITALERQLVDGTFIDPDYRLYDELMTYELKPDGRMGAVDGQHDDVVMSTAGAVYVAFDGLAPSRPKPIEYRKKRGGYASF